MLHLLYIILTVLYTYYILYLLYIILTLYYTYSILYLLYIILTIYYTYCRCTKRKKRLELLSSI